MMNYCKAVLTLLDFLYLYVYNRRKQRIYFKMTDKNLDYIQWRVRNGIYEFHPYTGMEMHVLTMEDKGLKCIHAARRWNMVCNGCYTQWYEPYKMTQCGDYCIIRVFSQKHRQFEKIVVNKNANFFKQYSECENLSFRALNWAARQMSGGACVPKDVGQKIVADTIQFCDNLPAGWHKKDVLAFINAKVQEVTHGR